MKPAVGWSLAGVVVLGLFAGLVIPSGGGCIVSAEQANSGNAISQVQGGSIAYRSEYGAFPESSENYRLAEALRGANPRNIVFIEPEAKCFNANGELIDGWGTPLRISYLSDDDLLIVSAGKDKLFGSKDDLSNKK